MSSKHWLCSPGCSASIQLSIKSAVALVQRGFRPTDESEVSARPTIPNVLLKREAFRIFLLQISGQVFILPTGILHEM